MKLAIAYFFGAITASFYWAAWVLREQKDCGGALLAFGILCTIAALIIAWGVATYKE